MSADKDDPLADWFGDSASGAGDVSGPGRHPFDSQDGHGHRTGSSRRPVVVIGVAAAALWTTVAVLGATGAPEDRPPPSPAGTPLVAAPALGPTAPPASSPSPGRRPVPDPGPAPDPRPSPDPRHSPDPGLSREPNPSAARAAALAVVALHDLVSATPDAETARWIDAAAVEAIETLDVVGPPAGVDDGAAGLFDARAPGAVAVVTLQAIVLDGDDDGWTGRRRARFALPVACADGRCREVAAPWPLADDAAQQHAAPPATGADDAHLVGALTAEGYREVSIAETAALWPGVVEVRADAVAPGEGRTREHVVWVLGSPPAERARRATAQVLGGGRPD